MAKPVLDIATCDFETLLALADQMPRERFEQIKLERPDFAEWLAKRRAPEGDGSRTPDHD